jgi:hypothetical protein
MTNWTVPASRDRLQQNQSYQQSKSTTAGHSHRRLGRATVAGCNGLVDKQEVSQRSLDLSGGCRLRFKVAFGGGYRRSGFLHSLTCAVRFSE